MKSKQIILYYGLFICLLLTIAGVISAKNFNDLLSSFIYIPLIFFFATQLLHKKAITQKQTPKIVKASVTKVISPTQIIEGDSPTTIADNDKRLFLKLVGSAGFSLLFMAMFTKKAQAAFFGSVPGPGTVAIKNSAGVQIDPAEAHPTDGYEITEIDDTSSPSYYGFLKKNGYWYIMKEDSTGAYRYSKGTTAFTANWTNRASLTYDYFNSIFG